MALAATPLLRSIHSSAASVRIPLHEDVLEFFESVERFAGRDQIPIRLIKLIIIAAIRGEHRMLTFLECLSAQNKAMLGTALEINLLELWDPITNEKIHFKSEETSSAVQPADAHGGVQDLCTA